MQTEPLGPGSGPSLSAGFWLHHAALAWRAELDRRLRGLDLTHTQFLVLASIGWLGRHGAAPSQQAVSDHAGADRMMVSRVVRTLEEKGLVGRSSDPSDGRTVRLEVTAGGRARVDAATAVVRSLDAECFGPTRDRLRRDLAAVADQLGRRLDD